MFKPSPNWQLVIAHNERPDGTTAGLLGSWPETGLWEMQENVLGPLVKRRLGPAQCANCEQEFCRNNSDVTERRLAVGRPNGMLFSSFLFSFVCQRCAQTRRQRVLSSVDPNLPFSGFHDTRDLMAVLLAMQRIEVALLTAMASLAPLLSAVGIFALAANQVAQRAREIGIRMALGSTVREAMMHIGSAGVGAAAPERWYAYTKRWQKRTRVFLCAP